MVAGENYITFGDTPGFKTQGLQQSNRKKRERSRSSKLGILQGNRKIASDNIIQYIQYFQPQNMQVQLNSKQCVQTTIIMCDT